MIYYVREGNTVYAYYGNLDGDITNNQYASKYWYNDLLRYFLKHTPEISRDDIGEVILSVISECTESGMKFYSEVKCHSEDTFDEDVGKELAKKRLLAKYNRVLSMLDVELLKALQNDIDFINKYKEEHKERGNIDD